MTVQHLMGSFQSAVSSSYPSSSYTGDLNGFYSIFWVYFNWPVKKNKLQQILPSHKDNRDFKIQRRDGNENIA